MRKNIGRALWFSVLMSILISNKCLLFSTLDFGVYSLQSRGNDWREGLTETFHCYTRHICFHLGRASVPRVCGWGRSIFNDGGSTWQRGRGEIVTCLLWVRHFLVWNHTGLKSQSRALSVVNKCYIGVYRGMVWQRQRKRLYIINFCLCGVCLYSHVLMSVRLFSPANLHAQSVTGGVISGVTMTTLCNCH